MAKRVAFFDVDGTVLKRSTGLYAGIQLFKKGHFKVADLLDTGVQSVLHYFGSLDHDAIYHSTINILGSLSLDELAEICYDAFVESVRGNILLGTAQIIEMHKARGEDVVFISAGPHGLIEIMGQYFDITDVIITKLKYNENEILDPALNRDAFICYGKNKVILANEYLDGKGISLDDCYFYSDSSSDLPLMSVVGHPVAINPDMSLRVKAFLKRWPTYFFQDTLGDIKMDDNLSKIDMQKIKSHYKQHLVSA